LFPNQRLNGLFR